MIKHSKDMNEKFLNQAFYVTLFYAGTSLLAIFAGYFYPNPLLFLYLIVFVYLGFLVKKGSFVASRVLLGIFIIDRITTAFLLLENSPSPINIAFYLVISFTFWRFLRAANLYLKRKKS